MKTIDTTDFDSIVLSLASPEQILEWSYGEVTKPETINYRTSRSERGGLFDEKIFGPEKDYECYCGKYKRIRYAGIVCEKCGVEVTRAIVRRDRMGHIELASPVAHIWFLKGVPSRMATLLAIPAKELEKVVYFAGYIIVKVDEAAKEQVLFDLESEFKAKVKTANDEETKEKLKAMLSAIKKEVAEIQVGKVLNEIQYHHYSLKYAACFEASIGAEAIYNIFKSIDLEKLKERVELLLSEAGNADRDKVQKRLSMIRALLNAGIRPEWMFLTVIPIIPPALRPMVALEGNRHATSDINDLYRRVINRNNRLKKLKEIGAPDVILRNEKRIMQEAVDSLIDNNAGNSQQSAQSQSQKRALKSLSDNLRSKHGLLRQNLLGKRVDYSGRSVIVVGPQLKLNQCGLPKEMALELFRPFVISKILARELAFNIRGANKLIEERDEAVWAILDEVIEGKYVLLNRAPTLHRLSIQAFNPILVEGEAIQLHPLVCTGFNADFDGDQMAVHLPLSKEAQEEAGTLMASNKNLLKPANGEPIGTAKLLDIILGCYWMTKNVTGEKGEGNTYASPSDALLAHDYGQINYHSKIKVRGNDTPKYAHFENQIFETSVGRILFNEALPESFPFVNDEINSKKVTGIVDSIVIRDGFDAGPLVLDSIKNFGYKYATVSGVTWAIDNVHVPAQKGEIVENHRKLHAEIVAQYEDGLLSTEEKYQKVTELWEQCKKEVEKLLIPSLDPKGSYIDMINSGARGTMNNVIQMAGMKGLIQNNQGRTIEFPVIPSYIEGLSPVEYFITTHGSRKGLSDTALNTARAGYLTRRLVDVSQDITIYEEDCGTVNGKIVRKRVISGLEIPISKGLTGRIIHEDIFVPGTKEVLFAKGSLLSKADSLVVEKAGVETVLVRSPLTCECHYGVCQQCYGLDLGRNHLVKLGEAVGIVAGQAIGEPGTQLTLRTFHQGGVVGVDITQGLPRVEEIFERRSPEHPAIVSKTTGEVIEVKGEGREKIVTVLSDTKNDGKGNTEEYTINYPRVPIVKPGDKLIAGQVMTDGSASIDEIFYYGGKDMAQEYIIHEISKVYEVQGASISPKHCEIIIRQMFSRVRITDSGETSLTPGDITERTELIEENIKAKAMGLKEATGQTVVLGISETAIRTKSWLSAASFQQTNKVLINNALKGGKDPLRGLKENVIVGRLIPAGTGFKKKSK
jgi:DNA-directed RNA polymerase subunit beta'